MFATNSSNIDQAFESVNIEVMPTERIAIDIKLSRKRANRNNQKHKLLNVP